ERVPLRFPLPVALAPGDYEIRASVRFSTGETQTDSFPLQVLPRPAPPIVTPRIVLLDPKGETARRLEALGVHFERTDPRFDVVTDLTRYDVLVIGKGALAKDGPGLNVDRVRDGLKVIVFEQSPEVLEQRFGFRVAEYGLRQIFARVPGHPLLQGLNTGNLRDWRGEATLLPPRLQYTLRPRYGPTVKWCDVDVTRIWRCGCRG